MTGNSENTQDHFAGSSAPGTWRYAWAAGASLLAITDSIAEAQINLNFERLEVLEGELVISGTKRAK